MVGVSVGKYALGQRLDFGAVKIFDSWYVHAAAVGIVSNRLEAVHTVHQIVGAYDPRITFAYLPQLDRLVIGGEEEMGHVLSTQPPDLVDLLLDLQTLQVVELGLVTLECAVNVVIGAYIRR